MPNEPKLFAVFGPDGVPYLPNRGVGWPYKWRAWMAVTSGKAEERRLKRAGYKCLPVKIVPVDEVAK